MGQIKVLAAKPGLDGHDRGIKVLCKSLINAGMEVIYTGLRQTPLQIINAAIDENVDVIAMSILSGAHNHILPKIGELIQIKQIDALVIVGGLIPEEDIDFIEQNGIDKVFSPNVNPDEVIKYIQHCFKNLKN
jgi:methylmalonyl-CoA mutase C-terminal domain/subunit